MMEKAFEWHDILGWDDDGITQSRCNWIAVAETVEEARAKILNSKRFADKPEVLDGPPVVVRELPS
jgi:hypothetical protein